MVPYTQSFDKLYIAFPQTFDNNSSKVPLLNNLLCISFTFRYNSFIIQAIEKYKHIFLSTSDQTNYTLITGRKRFKLNPMVHTYWNVYYYCKTSLHRKIKDIQDQLWLVEIHLFMFGYSLCLETLNVPYKNMTGCGYGCRNRKHNYFTNIRRI